LPNFGSGKSLVTLTNKITSILSDYELTLKDDSFGNSDRKILDEIKFVYNIDGTDTLQSIKRIFELLSLDNAVQLIELIYYSKNGVSVSNYNYLGKEVNFESLVKELEKENIIKIENKFLVGGNFIEEVMVCINMLKKFLPLWESQKNLASEMDLEVIRLGNKPIFKDEIYQIRPYMQEVNINHFIQSMVDFRSRFDVLNVAIKNITINYNDKSIELDFSIHVSESLKKTRNSVEIALPENFIVTKLRDQEFKLIPGIMLLDNSKYSINLNKLNSNENYIISVKGNISSKLITDLVKIKLYGANDNSEKYNTYWLNAIIQNIDLLEKYCKVLQIEDINIGVDISIVKLISSELPPELTDISKKTIEFLNAGYTTDRDKLFHAWRDLHKAHRNFRMDYANILKVINSISDASEFARYLSIKPPFHVAGVRRVDKYAGYIPQKIEVDILTDLSLTQPVANGELIFKKEDYINHIKKQLTLLK
jgi:predicted  nucleic acid-binding Zn-ribbon protein